MAIEAKLQARSVGVGMEYSSVPHVSWNEVLASDNRTEGLKVLGEWRGLPSTLWFSLKNMYVIEKKAVLKEIKVQTDSAKSAKRK
jgi:hypothetical protein